MIIKLQMNGRMIVTFEYNSQVANIEVEPFKLINYLIEKAYSLFLIPKENKIKLLFNGKNIAELPTTKLCDCIGLRTKIKLKVIKDVYSVKEIIFLRKSVGSGNISQDYQTLGISYARSSSLGKSLSMSNDLAHSSESLHNFANFYKVYTNNKDNTESLKHKCSCDKEIISYLCRTCNAFICHSCKLETKHKFHFTFLIDLTDLNESVKIYSKNLQADIGLKVRLNKSNKDFKKLNLETCKNEVMKKMNELEKKNSISLTKYTKSDSTNVNIPKFYEKSENLKKELTEMMTPENHHYSSASGMGSSPNKQQVLNSSNSGRSFQAKVLDRPNSYKLADAKKKFLLINEKEDQIQDLLNEVKLGEMNFKIHMKIDEMYNIIENSIDAVIKTEVDTFKNNDDIIFDEEPKSKISSYRSKELIPKSVDFHDDGKSTARLSKKKIK